MIITQIYGNFVKIALEETLTFSIDNILDSIMNFAILY